MASKGEVKIGTKIVHTLFGGGRYEAIVEGIEKCKMGEKYGKPISKMPMTSRDRAYVLSLSNGHWCYGSQVLEILEE